MGLRGPAPTPLKILELRGSPRALHHPEAPRPPPKRPSAPEWLTGDARKTYHRLTAHLHAMGVLAGIDQHALARYAMDHVLWLQCREFVTKHGTTYAVRAKPAAGEKEGAFTAFKAYPQAKHALALADQLLRLEREFGMTPAARARLVVGAELLEDPADAGFFAGDQLAAAK